MGVDITPRSGVAITAAKLAKIVTEDNTELACRTLLRYTSKVLQALKNDMSDEELNEWDRRRKQEIAKLMLSCFESLTIESTVDDVRKMLAKMAPGVVDGFDSYVANGEEAVEIWGELIGVMFAGAPLPEDTLCIGSSRYQGTWELPHGEAIFVFSKDECFERVKTEAGKQLDSMLGETTELASWTSCSV